MLIKIIVVLLVVDWMMFISQNKLLGVWANLPIKVDIFLKWFFYIFSTTPPGNFHTI